MSTRRNYYFRQLVTEAELDEGFDDLEVATRALMTDGGLLGVQAGAEVTQHAGTPNLTVDIAGSAVIYDKLGQRISWGPVQNVDVSVDEDSVSTAVSGGGNSKIVSVFAKFKRILTDPRTDGNTATVYFLESESFEFVVRQSSEAVSPTPPTLDAEYILLADITRTLAAPTILDAVINAGTNRREDAIVADGTPYALRQGLVVDALSDIVGFLNDLAGSAGGIAYGGGTTWFDGTTNPATTVEAQLDKIVSDLRGTAGAVKIGTAATGNWFGGAPIVAGSVQSQINSVVSVLAATTGAAQVGSAIQTQSPTSLAAGSAQSQITALLTALNALENQKSAASGLAALDSGSKLTILQRAGFLVVDAYYSNNTKYGVVQNTTSASFVDAGAMTVSLANCKNGDIIKIDAKFSMDTADAAGAEVKVVANSNGGGFADVSGSLVEHFTINSDQNFSHTGGRYLCTADGTVIVKVQLRSETGGGGNSTDVLGPAYLHAMAFRA